MIDFTPTDEQSLIQETVHQFAENELRPTARESDERAELSSDVLHTAHELGLVATALPEAMGGGGERNALTSCLIAEELAWGDLSTALAILSPSLLGLPVADFGTDEQKESLLPSLLGADFEAGSLALVEPRFDFDPFRPRTTATREGDEYVIEGQKCLTPWLEGAGPILVAANEDGTPQLFIVPRDASGVKSVAESNLGTRALPTVELSLDRVRIPASARLGGAQGSSLSAVVNRGRVGLAAAAVGVARAAFEQSVAYAKERETFGAPIATRQAIAFKLADMAIEIDGVRLLTWEAAWKLDRGDDVTREAALAIQQARRVVREVSDGAVQVFGGHGYIREYLPEMYLRNAFAFTSFEAATLV